MKLNTGSKKNFDEIIGLNRNMNMNNINTHTQSLDTKTLILPSLKQMEMSTLPREVLKWIQSLDLTYSVKNVKKDFNNGFLVAQILSRHYPAFVQMHSIDNGFSMERRRDNWQLIFKYLKEINNFLFSQNKETIKIEVGDLESLIENKDNEILTFIIRLYEELTNKRIPQLEGKKTKTDTDAVNKSYLLKENGEVELIKKDNEAADKRTEDMQKSLKSNASLLTQYKNTNVVMKGEMKPISRDLTNLDSKNFKVAIFEPKESEGPTKLLRQVRIPNPNENVNKLMRSGKMEDQGADLNNYDQLIMTSAHVEEAKPTKVKNPFEWFEEKIIKKMQMEYKEDFDKIKVETKFIFDLFKQADNISLECLDTVLTETNKMIEEYFNILYEQINEYVHLFLTIFDTYMNKDLLDERKFKSLHDSLITFFIKSLRIKSDEMLFIFKKFFLQKIFGSMSSMEYKERNFYFCQLIYKVMDPVDQQQVELFKLFKDNIKSEVILYSSFSNLHDMVSSYSENLIDACLYYILCGLNSENTEIRYHSLYMLSKYVPMNINFFYNFERKIEKLAKRETDRENCLLIIKMACLFLKNANLMKTKPKESISSPGKKQSVFSSEKIDEETNIINYLNELQVGNGIIGSIMRRFTGDSLFMLLSCLSISEFLYDNTDLYKILLRSLFDCHDNIHRYIFYDEPLDDQINYVLRYTPCRHEPQLVKFRDWNFPYMLKAYDILTRENDLQEISPRDYTFLLFVLRNGINPLNSEIYKNHFKFSHLVIQDLKIYEKCHHGISILETFLLCEPISKHILDECFDNLQNVFRFLADDNTDNSQKCISVIVPAIKNWIPNTSSILRDALRKLLEILQPQSSNIMS